MTKKTNLHPSLSPLPVRWADLQTVTKLINEHVAPKFKGIESGIALLRVRSQGRVQSSALDQRMFIHVQRKNKHPHSTKKHK